MRLFFSFPILLLTLPAFAEPSSCEKAREIPFDAQGQALFQGASFDRDFGDRAQFTADLTAGEVVDFYVTSSLYQHHLMFDYGRDCTFPDRSQRAPWEYHHRYRMTAKDAGRYDFQLAPHQPPFGADYRIQVVKHLPKCGDGHAEGLELWDDWQTCGLSGGDPQGKSCEAPLLMRGDHLTLSFDRFSEIYADRFQCQGSDRENFEAFSGMGEFWLDIPADEGDSLYIWGMSGYESAGLVESCGKNDCPISGQLFTERKQSLRFPAPASGLMHFAIESPSNGPGVLEVERLKNRCGDGIIGGFEQCDPGPHPAGYGCTKDCKLEEAMGQSCETAIPIFEGLELRGDHSPTDRATWFKLDLKKGERLDVTSEYGTSYYIRSLQASCDRDAEPLKFHRLKKIAGDLHLSEFIAPKDVTLYIERRQDNRFLMRFERSMPVCGDGKIEGLEQCEDGNQVSGDGCSAECETEPGWFCAKTKEGSRCMQAPMGAGLTEETAFLFEGSSMHLAGESFNADFKGQKTANEASKAFIAFRLERGEAIELRIKGVLFAELSRRGAEYPMLYAADHYRNWGNKEIGRDRMFYRARQAEDLILSFESPSGPQPYEIALQRQPKDDRFEAREREISAFISGGGAERRTLTLSGEAFADDFAAIESSSCEMLKDTPNASFTLTLEKGELLSVNVECPGEDCPIPMITTNHCVQKEGACSPALYPCKILDEPGYEVHQSARNQSYRAKKRETVKLEIALPLETRQRCHLGLCDNFSEQGYLYTSRVQMPYRIDLIRSRKKPAKPSLGQNPQKPIVAQFNAEGKAVIAGDNFEDDFKTPKSLQVKIDSRIPWIPSAWIAIDLKSGEKLLAKSSLGHHALVRMGKTAELILDEWTLTHGNEDPEERAQERNPPHRLLPYEAQKDERIYLVISPRAHCLWKGCLEVQTDPYRTLKGEKRYSKERLQKEAEEYSEADRWYFMKQYEKCDQASCELQNKGPYRVELWKR